MVKSRINRFQKELEENSFDTFFISNRINVYYFTNFYSKSSAYLLVFQETMPVLYVPQLEYEEASSLAEGCEVKKFEKGSQLLKFVRADLESNRSKKGGIEEVSMSIKSYRELSEKIEFVEWGNGVKLIDKLRRVKNEGEIMNLREACKIADSGITTALEIIGSEKSELEIAAEIEYAMRKSGSEGAPFDTIVASGYRSAYPHGVSTKKKIKKGDLIIIDLGARFNGYCSDMTRTVVLGSPSEKQSKILQLVLEAEQNAIRACIAGKNASEVEEEVRAFLSAKEYNEYFVHSLGHGVGLDVHEYPVLANISEDVFEEGNVFTVEPGIYLPDWGGVRIEDVVYLTEKGPEILTKSNYELII